MKKAKPYFDGFYLKHQNNGKMVAFIISYHIDISGEEFALIQMITNDGAYFKKYHAELFKSNPDYFNITIGENSFSLNGIIVDIDFDGFHVCGKIDYSNITPLKSDIMGPFRSIPLMECKHGILSLKHDLKGELSVNGVKLDFSGGLGYIEKDEGISFPKRYLWTQCHIGQNDSVVLAIADIPMIKMNFRGMICEILYDNKNYRLATYTMAKVVNFSENYVAVKQKKLKLEIYISEHKSFELKAPKNGGMARVIHESPCQKVRYKFSKGSELIFDITSEFASFEIFDEEKLIDIAR